MAAEEAGEVLGVIGLDVGAGGDVEERLLCAGRVEVALGLLELRGEAGDTDAGCLVGDRRVGRDAPGAEVIPEAAAADADEGGVVDGPIHLAGVVALGLSPALALQRLGGRSGTDDAVAVAVVGGEDTLGAGGGPEPTGGGSEPGRHVPGELIEELLVGDVLLERIGLQAVGEEVVLAAAGHLGRVGREEPDLVLHHVAADGAAEFVLVIDGLGVLLVGGIDAVGIGIEKQEALDGAGVDAAAGIVVVGLTVELVAAGAGDGADDTAEGAAVFGVDAAGFHLDFLKKFEGGILAGAAINQAVGGDAVDEELVLRATGAIDLEAAFDLARVDTGREEDNGLEGAGLGQEAELRRGDVGGDGDAAGIDLRGGLGDLDGLLGDADFESDVDVGLQIMGSTNSPVLKLAAVIAASHHEKWDGTGYPNQIAGDKIPLEGRIVAVADVFDALSSARPYKEAFPIEKCLRILREGRGTHFDPNVLDAFLRRQDEAISICSEYAEDDNQRATR